LRPSAPCGGRIWLAAECPFGRKGAPHSSQYCEPSRFSVLHLSQVIIVVVKKANHFSANSVSAPMHLTLRISAFSAFKALSTQRPQRYAEERRDLPERVLTIDHSPASQNVARLRRGPRICSKMKLFDKFPRNSYFSEFRPLVEGTPRWH